MVKNDMNQEKLRTIALNIYFLVFNGMFMSSMYKT